VWRRAPGLRAASHRFLVHWVLVLLAATCATQNALAKDPPAAVNSAAASKGEHKSPKRTDQTAPRKEQADHKAGRQAVPKGDTPKDTSKDRSSKAAPEDDARPKSSKESKPANLGPVETTPTPEPKRVIQPTIKINPPKTIPHLTTKTTPNSDMVIRNAIGTRFPSQAGSRPPQPSQGSSAEPGAKGTAQNIRTTTPTSQQQGFGAATGNRGAINGNDFGRPSAAIIGGRTKPLAQIDGSTIRSKH
jgi:hypothetical protein